MARTSLKTSLNTIASNPTWTCHKWQRVTDTLRLLEKVIEHTHFAYFAKAVHRRNFQQSKYKLQWKRPTQTHAVVKMSISQKTDITVLAQLECVKPDTLNCIGLYIKRKNLHFNCQITKQSQPNNEVYCSSCNRCFGLPSEFLNLSFMTYLLNTIKQIFQIFTFHSQLFE